jgi:2,5-diketo-D-gluconate reductase A
MAMSVTTVPRLELNDGHQIPQLGFGVFQVPSEQTVGAVTHALQTGYRLIDTAAAYGNEAEVGAAIRAGQLPREDLFVTTKLWNDSQGRDRARRAFEDSLERLGLEYVDLYLIHWPAPNQDLYVETWEALEELRADGRARSIGVSNFLPEHLDRIIDASGTVPAVNQIELHPLIQQAELRDYHARHGIVTEAWSPLAKGQLLDDPVIRDIAQQCGRTPAQIILRWHAQIGNVAIPKSITTARIEENAGVFDFELEGAQLVAIEALDRGQRTGPDPRRFG